MNSKNTYDMYNFRNALQFYHLPTLEMNFTYVTHRPILSIQAFFTSHKLKKLYLLDPREKNVSGKRSTYLLFSVYKIMRKRKLKVSH